MNSEITMDTILKQTINTCFKEQRARKHTCITSESARYSDPRTRKRDENGNAIHKFSAIGIANEYTKQVINIIFDMIPNLKGSNAITGYIRYGLTNRWPNRFQYTKRMMDDLENAVIASNIALQTNIFNTFTRKKINAISKEEFINLSNDDKISLIIKWRKMPKITNSLYNEQSAKEFIESNVEERINILRRWACVTLPTTNPSTFIVRFCNNSQQIEQIQQQRFDSNIGGDSKTDIDTNIQANKYEEDAKNDGVTSEDKKLFRNLISTLHDSYKDLRDYSPDEVLAFQHKYNDETLIPDENGIIEDWSNVNWDEEELEYI